MEGTPVPTSIGGAINLIVQGFGTFARAFKTQWGTKYDAAGDIGTDITTLLAAVDSKVLGRARLSPTTIDLNQAANTYDLFTGTTQAVILDFLVLTVPNGGVAGAVTSISVQTNDATPQIIIDAASGAVVNLTTENQLGWSATTSNPIYIAVGKKIQLTIAGGAAGVAKVCNVVAVYRSIVSGGYLA